MTTGSNGVLGVAFTNTQQYIATPAILPDGVIDLVGVEVSAQQVPNGPFIPIATAQTGVDSKLGLTFELNPWTQDADFAQAKTMQAVVREREGSIRTSSDLYYEYKSSIYAGDITPGSNVRTQLATVTYTAFPIGQQLSRSPRVDQVDVTFYNRQSAWSGDVFGRNSVSYNFINLGTAHAYIEVGKDTYVGRFAVVTVPTPAAACVYAYIFVPKGNPPVPQPKSYAVKAYGFNDVGGYGTSYTKTFSGATGSGLTDVVDAGTEWKMGLDGGCAISASGVAFRQNLYATRFAGIKVEVKVTP